MKNRKISKIIKNSIYLDFTDISDKLIVDEAPIKQRKIFKFNYCVNFCIIILIITISLFYTLKIGISYKNTQKNLIEKVQINDFSYLGDNYILTENNFIIKHITNEELMNLFGHRLEVGNVNTQDILCNYNLTTNKLIQCSVSYNVNFGLLLISIKKNTLPTFETEKTDTWEKNTFDKDLEVSNIENHEITILKNTNNSSYIKEYWDKDVTNYKTKFMINDIGIAIDSYNVDEKQFLQILRQILSENS